jgi:hypothetical protein
MKRYTFTRGDMENYQDDPGKVAERIVESEYANLTRFGVENFDLSSDEGQLAEVKSTQTTLANGNAGRWRLWKDQHEKLLRADREGTARYVFVLVTVDARPLEAKMVQRIPADVGNKIGARGGWNESGHPSGRQHKLPVDAIL